MTRLYIPEMQINTKDTSLVNHKIVQLQLQNKTNEETKPRSLYATQKTKPRETKSQ